MVMRPRRRGPFDLVKATAEKGQDSVSCINPYGQTPGYYVSAGPGVVSLKLYPPVPEEFLISGKILRELERWQVEALNLLLSDEARRFGLIAETRWDMDRCGILVSLSKEC